MVGFVRHIVEQNLVLVLGGVAGRMCHIYITIQHPFNVVALVLELFSAGNPSQSDQYPIGHRVADYRINGSSLKKKKGMYPPLESRDSGAIIYKYLITSTSHGAD